MRWTLLLLGALLTFGMACDGDDDDDSATSDDDATDDDDVTDDDDDDVTDDDDDDDTTPVELRGGCTFEDKVGWFVVQHEADYSYVSGEVRDGVVPITVRENVLQQGDCTLWRSNNPFCDPSCSPDETCDFDGECIPYPSNLDLGTVTIDGLNKEVSMDPPGGTMPATYYDTQMPQPAFDPGAEVRLEAEGNEIAGFTLFGEGFEPIVIPDEPWVVVDGEPLDVTWTPDGAGQATVWVRLNIDQHGTTPVEIWCDVADTGSLSVPADVMDALIGYGVSGFATGTIYRHTLDSVTVETGCVQFEVVSRVPALLEVEGHIPCDSPDDCPDGMECDYATGTCV
jgi:hypothetical protein